MGQGWVRGRQTNNNGGLLSDISRVPAGLILNNNPRARRLGPMKQLILSLGLSALIALAAAPASAECYADYKAKQDNPLQLHYGVIALPDTACGSVDVAASEIAGRIGRDGWTLLDVVSIFGASGLDEKRKESAGDFYLRY